jgi:opacity protein-like surface antigen
VKKLLFIAALCSTSVCFSQRFSAELFGGVSNYTGDFIESKYTFQGAKPAFGLGVGYAVTDHIGVRAMFSFTKLGADDKNNNDPYLLRRNLNFKTNIAEFTVMGQYFFFNTTTSRINPYLTAGIGVFHYNPYTFDTAGNKHYLKPLSTEGQGLSQYPDRKPYSLTQFTVPFGAGIRFRVTENISLGWEIVLRKTFTDYLDDLSNSYIDEDILRTAKGDKAVELAYRSGEIKDGNPVYPVEGTTRGGIKAKDWYYFSGITASFRVGNGNFFGGKGSGTGCPAPVF